MGKGLVKKICDECGTSCLLGVHKEGEAVYIEKLNSEYWAFIGRGDGAELLIKSGDFDEAITAALALCGGQ